MRKKIRIVYQHDSMDCGPACLSMIATYHGIQINRNRLRYECNLTKEGVSFCDISKAAEKLGFQSIAASLSITALLEKNSAPCIIHWNQNHFVVLAQIKKHRNGHISMVIADPAKGVLTYPVDLFLTFWAGENSNTDERHGLALFLEKRKNLYNSKKDLHSFKSRVYFLSEYLHKYRGMFFQLTISILLGSILQLIFPLLAQSIVDIGIAEKDIDLIWLILLAQMVLLLSRVGADFIRAQILLHISTRINISIVSDFLIKIMKLPMSFFDTKLTGDILQRIEDHRRVEHFLTTNTLNILFSTFSFSTFGLILLIYSKKIFVTFLISMAIYSIWTLLFLKKRKSLDYLYFDYNGRNRNVTYQLVNSMQEIKLQGCEQQKRWEWEDLQSDIFIANIKKLNLQQLQHIGSIIINELKNILITMLAATAVISENMTLGMMLSVQYIVGQLHNPVEQLVQFIYSWQDISIGLDRMTEIHSEPEEDSSSQSGKHYSQSILKDGSISIRGLYFKYDLNSTKHILYDINLFIPDGKVTAIVGASGSGKTTLIKLLLGFYKPISGSIKIGDIDLSSCSMSWWRKQCGAVMQEGYLFSDTIARNIGISDEEVCEYKVSYAADITNISEYIETLPLKYNTMIGQDGQALSQGQKQRILIARVIYKNPKFVFLDEATNSLDANNERIITKHLYDFYKKKTVVVIAHRLSTVCNADQIVVLDHGRVVEIGKHEQLVALKGKYYDLVRNQLELGN